MAEDGIDVDLNWNLSGVFEGIGSSLSSAGANTWESVKSMSEESAGAVFGVVMILIAGMVIWRVAK
jgi:hypothetical protein